MDKRVLIKFLKSSEYQTQANEIFLSLKKKIHSLLPSSRVEHIGSSSIDGMISKGDLDIFLGVDRDDHTIAVELIESLGFDIKVGTLRTEDLCMLTSSLFPIDVAVQVVVNGSAFEDFLRFRDMLQSDIALKNEYNEIKESCAGLSEDDYRAKKSLFIENVLVNIKTMNQPIIITTQRLILRPYEIKDWERVHIYGADPDFSKYELWGPNTIEDTHKFIADMVEQGESNPRYKFDFAVCLKDSGLLIGGCGIRRETESSQVANLGWAINPEFQNQGFATEAARAVIDFGINKIKLKVIYATCDTRNVPSFKVMEKLEMKRVGFIKGTKEVKGHIRDAYRYEL